MVPHLITANNGPINELEQRILDATPVIERWFRLEWMEHTPPFYASVDVRNAGFKLAPVDTSLYPSAWNNLNAAMLPLAVQAAVAAIEKICPEARNLLIVPGPHLNDAAYLGNLARLRQIFHMAGLHVRIGSIDPKAEHNQAITLPDGEQITIEPVVRNNGRLEVPHFDPCTILLNHDLRQGVPGILEDLHTQNLLPPLHAGWHTRRNHRHLQCYEEVAKRFGKLIGVEPWLFNPLFEYYPGFDARQAEQVAQLQEAVDGLLGKIKKRYKDYGIQDKPFVVIKGDNGSMGMGAMTVRDAKQLPALLAAKACPHADAHDLILQEGVLTHERIHNAVAEPVVYTLDRYVVGGFYRMHPDRGPDEDLSAPGAHYVPLAFKDGIQLPQPDMRPGASAPNRFYMYGVIARLALLAASYELEATDPLAEEDAAE